MVLVSLANSKCSRCPLPLPWYHTMERLDEEFVSMMLSGIDAFTLLCSGLHNMYLKEAFYASPWFADPYSNTSTARVAE